MTLVSSDILIIFGHSLCFCQQVHLYVPNLRQFMAIITALHMIMENLEAIKGGYAARIECWEHTRMLADAFAEPPAFVQVQTSCDNF